MLNLVAIMGRLVADPQMRQTTTGKNVVSIRVAVDRSFSTGGQRQADFFDVVVWERSAEFVCKYFQKGSMIAIDGRLQSRQYQDKTGNNRTAIEIVAQNINFCGSKSSGGDNSNYASGQEYSRPSAAPIEAASSYSAGDNDDFAVIDSGDDLPF